MKNLYDIEDIPWNGQCIMLDGVHKQPMTASEASRKADEKGLYYYRCKYCDMYHLSSKKPRK